MLVSVPTVKSASHTLSNYLAGYYAKIILQPVFILFSVWTAILLVWSSCQKTFTTAPAFFRRYSQRILAIIKGTLPAKHGNIEASDARKPDRSSKEWLRSERQICTNDYKLLVQYSPELSLTQFILFTGRTHQIRVHSAYIGCPLIGDNLYGAPGPQARHALHCWRLEFQHPVTGKMIKVSSPLPADLLKIISTYRQK
jgi:hypothetical protein